MSLWMMVLAIEKKKKKKKNGSRLKESNLLPANDRG